MKTYPTEKVRNVAIVGHQGAGKTTLVEALLFASGATNRMGTVEDGNTVTDFDEEEHRRSQSVSLALAPIEWSDHKINLLDVPGYADFLGDVCAALEVADIALFVVSAVEGVEVQTEIAWKLAEQRGLPRLIFVNKLDRERASFQRTLDQCKELFGAGVAPIQLPIGEETALSGVVNLLADVAYTYDHTSATGQQGAIPDAMEAEEHSVHDQLVEGIVVGDDDLMERYLGDEKIEIDELAHALAKGVEDGAVFPVLCGSASKLVGVDTLATFLVEEAPAPEGADGAAGVYVFKTVVDPYVGRVNLFKMMQGTLKPDIHLINKRTSSDERLHQLFTLVGKEQQTLSEVATGDLAAVAKLADTTTGDVMAEKGTALEFDAMARPNPVLSVAIKPKNKGDEDKLANALHRLLDEDPALVLERNSETHQTLLEGMGEMHVAIALEHLKRKFGVEVETEDVKVPYRETITGKSEAEGRYKKQTGGHGQFGVAWLRVEPKGRGEGFEFVNAIVGGVIPRQFIPAVEKGVIETMEHGGVHGFPVVDVQATVYDGKHHAVDSSEMSFKMAGSIGFKAAMEGAEPIILEPISELVITAPEQYQGDIMGDLNSKRGRITGTASLGYGEVEISATVPTAEALRYAIELRSMTSGRGRFIIDHSHYEPLPTQLYDRVKTRP